MPSTPHTSINHFLIEDGQRIKNVYQRSILLEIQRELWYTTATTSKPIKFKDPWDEVEGSYPRLAPILLFVSAIDLIARVDKIKIPATNESRSFFVDCCLSHFNFSVENAERLWKARTSLVHQYKLPNGTMVASIGPVGEVIYYDKNKDSIWLFPYYMPRNLKKVIKNLSVVWLAESPSLKQKRAKFIDEFGFFYDNDLFNLSEHKFKRKP